MDILNDMEESNETENTKMKASGVMFESRNAEFLNKEISFFLDNLRKVSYFQVLYYFIQKAVDSGLGEDSLMPLSDNRDKQICNNIKHD